MHFLALVANYDRAREIDVGHIVVRFVVVKGCKPCRKCCAHVGCDFVLACAKVTRNIFTRLALAALPATRCAKLGVLVVCNYR